jgi:hypothetical protein
MVNKTRSINMIFNHIRWANDVAACRAELQITSTEAATLNGKVDGSQITRYERGEERNMKMQNFLALCNLYDLDPRVYFELEY